MQIPVKYFVCFCVFICALFIAPHAYSHWHFDVISPVELYQIDKEQFDKKYGGEIAYMSYYEWQIDQDERQNDFLNEIGHQICESLDPWYERNDNPTENTERGRD
jgi:hypothetical protein